jgi:hypothetical protein
LRAARWTVTGTDEPTGLSDEHAVFEVPADGTVHALTGVLAAPNGTLWLSLGDNADFAGMDPKALRAMDLNAPQGKILHITKDGLGVPANPYFDAGEPGSVRSRAFASGFRSPFRLLLDPKRRTPRPNGPVLTPHFGGHVTPSVVSSSSRPAGARSDIRHRMPGAKSAHPLAATGPEFALRLPR